MINQNCETIAGHFSLDQSVPRYCPVAATKVAVFDDSNSAGCRYICDEHAQVLFYGKATFTLYSVQRLPVDDTQ